MAKDPLLEACAKQPPSRTAKSFNLGIDKGGKGCLLKVRYINDLDDITFIPAPGVIGMSDMIRDMLNSNKIEDRRHEYKFEGSIPEITAEDWKIDAQNGQTVAAHSNILCALDGLWMVHTIYNSDEHRFTWFDRHICWDLVDEFEKAAPHMKAPEPRGPRSNARH